MKLRNWHFIVLTITMIFPANAVFADTAPDLPEWVHEVVCPVSWPVPWFPMLKDKTHADILNDFRPEIADTSTADPWVAPPDIQSNTLLPRKSWGGIEYDFTWLDSNLAWTPWEETYGSRWWLNEDCGAAVSSSGELKLDYAYGPPGQAFLCHNNARLHTVHKNSLLKTARDRDCAIVRQDNIGVPTGVIFDNGGWCKWCMAGYKARLQARFTPDRLRELGICDVATWDAAAYLRLQLAKKPEVTIEDTLVREYIRFLYKSNLESWRDEVDAVHTARAGLPVYGNQVGMSLNPYQDVLLSDVSDLIGLEHHNRVYPDLPNTVTYAVALAGGRHSKPAWNWGGCLPGQRARVCENLLNLAECYASGVRFIYPMDLGSDSVWQAMEKYAGFARRHKDLLSHSYAADAGVALIYSVPSFVPKFCGAFHYYLIDAASKQMDHLRGFGRYLEREHIPYNVEIMGDEELWPDKDLAERLDSYRVVVCPNVEAMSDKQAAILSEFVRRGGVLIASGNLATRDESFAKRPQPALVGLSRDSGKGRVFLVGKEPIDYMESTIYFAEIGIEQTVELNQNEAKPLVVRGWSKCEGVTHAPDWWAYSLRIAGTYVDGAPVQPSGVPFNSGTHDWQPIELVIKPARPVKSFTVLPVFSFYGTVWFDDLSLSEEGSDVNLLQNLGFELGTDSADFWKPRGVPRPGDSCVRDESASHSGKAAIKCYRPRPDGTGPAADTLKRVFGEALRAGGSPIRTDAPSTVFVRPVKKGNRMVVHLVNFDYDGSRDGMNSTGPFRLALQLPLGARNLVGSIRLLGPDMAEAGTTLPCKVNRGYLEMQIPSFDVWRMLCFELR